MDCIVLQGLKCTLHPCTQQCKKGIALYYFICWSFVLSFARQVYKVDQVEQHERSKFKVVFNVSFVSTQTLLYLTHACKQFLQHIMYYRSLYCFYRSSVLPPQYSETLCFSLYSQWNFPLQVVLFKILRVPHPKCPVPYVCESRRSHTVYAL